MSEGRIDPRIAKGLATALLVAVGVAVPLLLPVADISLPDLPDFPEWLSALLRWGRRAVVIGIALVLVAGALVKWMAARSGSP